MVLPEKAGTRVDEAVLRLPPVRMAGNGDAALVVDLLNNALDTVVRVDESFDIHGQDVIAPGLIGHFGSGDQDHAIFFPGPGGLLPDLLQVPVEIRGGNGAGLGKALPELGIDEVIGDADRIKTAGSIEIHHGFH